MVAYELLGPVGQHDPVLRRCCLPTRAGFFAIGTTPLRIALAPGAHDLSLQQAGFGERLHRIELSAGENRSIETALIASDAEDPEALRRIGEELGVALREFEESERTRGAKGGPPVTDRVESAEEVVTLARVHWELGGCGVLVARPPDTSIDVDLTVPIEFPVAGTELARLAESLETGLISLRDVLLSLT